MNSLKRLFQVIVFFSLFTLIAGNQDPGYVGSLREKALAGDRSSAFYLADAYYYGKKVRKNPVLAVYWYRIAAEKDLPEAQYNLACCLESGTGCRKDSVQAFSWYEKASSQGFDPASMRLFYLYRSGVKDADGKVIVKPSPEKALAVLRALAEKGHIKALYLLASHGMRREAPEEERSESFRILQKLVQSREDDGKALRMLADCYYGGIGCLQDPEKMLSLLKKAADLQDAEAVAKLGFLYERGFGSLEKDQDEAVSHYRKAAQMGHPVGQYKYALFLRKEAGEDPEELREAVSWLEKSASQKYAPALCSLGTIYLEGKVLPKDLRKAAGYFFQAAKSGNAPGQFQLAQMFRAGSINDRADHEAAFFWYMQAALQGYVPALHAAADCYLKGQGVERSMVKGMRFLRAAAERGDFAARRKLQRLLRADPYTSGHY